MNKAIYRRNKEQGKKRVGAMYAQPTHTELEQIVQIDNEILNQH